MTPDCPGRLELEAKDGDCPRRPLVRGRVHQGLPVGLERHQPAAGPKDSGDLVDRGSRLGDVLESPFDPDACERRRGERQLGCVADHDPEAQPKRPRTPMTRNETF